MPLSASAAILARLRRIMLASLLCGFAPALAVAADAPSPEACGLDSAEAAIATARERQALWTTAVKALSEARAACRRGAVDDALAWSLRARELARLGLIQRDAQTGDGRPPGGQP